MVQSYNFLNKLTGESVTMGFEVNELIYGEKTNRLMNILQKRFIISKSRLGWKMADTIVIPK